MVRTGTRLYEYSNVYDNWLIVSGRYLDNHLYIFTLFFLTGGDMGGKYSDQILRLNTTDFKWYEIGRMKEARAWHGMSVADNLLDACK